MSGNPPLVRLRVLATSDVHMHLSGYDYLTDSAQPAIGLARLAKLARVLREDGPSLLLDNGDLLQGTVLGDMAAKSDNPMPQVLAAMGYDAMGLGNHDMDFGLEAFARFANAAPVPLVCSNFDLPGTVPFSLITKDVPDGQVTVGIVSVLPPQTAIWNARHLEGLPPPRAPVEAAAGAVLAARDAGADVVVLLGHTGLAPDGPGMEENFGRALAQLDGVDALVLGHVHRHLPGKDFAGLPDVDADAGTVAGVPAVMPCCSGSCLGQIDLWLERRDGRWHVRRSQSRLNYAVNAPGEDETVSQIIAPLHTRALAHLGDVVGQTKVPLHSFFTPLQTEPGQVLAARAMRRAIAPALRAAGLEGLPLLAAAAPNASGGRGGPGNYLSVQPGNILRRHLATMLPYPNEVWALRLTGAELRAWLEQSAGIYQSADGQLVDPEFPVFNFDAIFGLTALYDPSQPQGARVTQVQHDGAPLRDNDSFLLVTTSYRAAGGGAFPGTGLDRVVARAQASLLDATTTLLAERPLGDLGPSPFKVDPKGAIRATLDTSPKAATHLHEIECFKPEVLGTLDSGFLRLGLTI